MRAALSLVAAWAASLAIALWQPLASGLRLGFGDRVDAMIEISLLEHWRRVWRAGADWTTTGYFFPHAGTLGYNDGYFLSGLIYTGWRWIADPFVSDTLTAATWKTIGFVAAYALVARTLRWGHGIALLVATLFTIANAMTLQAVHAQLQTVALVPVVFLLAIVVARGTTPLRAALAAVALALVIAAWLITAYYLAWFTIWFGCLFAAAWLWIEHRRFPRAVLAVVGRHRAPIAAGAAAFALAVLPFLSVYLRTAAETGEHRYKVMLGYLVTPPIDMINVGPDNLLWGWIWRGLMALVGSIAPHDPGLPGRVLGGEHSAGFPLLLFALIVTAGWRVLRRGQGEPTLRAFALAIAIGWLLTIQLWVLSPWGAVFALVPGAAGLRVVSRFQLFLILPVLLLAAAVWRDRLSAAARARPVLAAALVVLLIAEQINLAPVAALDRDEQRRALWAIPPPPAACRSFYVVAARTGEPVFRTPERHGILAHNVDAMLLASLWGVPTLNGYATFRPPDWDMAAPLAPDYDSRMLRYARAHGLRGVCRLDVRGPQPWRVAVQ